uniref:Uncharacterized protein n=1 Tax=Steinernema glaseri TaxID=37863 RepID=A0A1I7XY31_9BILA
MDVHLLIDSLDRVRTRKTHLEGVHVHAGTALRSHPSWDRLGAHEPLLAERAGQKEGEREGGQDAHRSTPHPGIGDFLNRPSTRRWTAEAGTNDRANATTQKAQKKGVICAREGRSGYGMIDARARVPSLISSDRRRTQGCSEEASEVPFSESAVAGNFVIQ